ncbi:hypothetical protein B0H17DRAFT_513878 [Mycena rosella]|uniref:Uncharacterized protein n=1 Tax=Mycena rosella TaxID=1033263 RepID=A0AAD7BVL2_MYCRO|nr:hypothetical protein B0H17DRAFT_513878 [Mycena rosella]
MARSTLESLALAIYRIVMVSSAGDVIVSRELEGPSVLGEMVVKNAERVFGGSSIQFRHYLPLSFNKSYKWTWYDDTTTGIYHGIPGWTRFTLRREGISWTSSWTKATSIVLGDDGDNVDNWDVLLACLTNWAGVDADLPAFCMGRCSPNTQVGFVTKIDFTTHVRGFFVPLPGYDAADTVYLFIEDLRAQADGHVPPCRRYHSLDRTGATRMSAGLETLYGVDQSVSWNVRKSVKFFDREQYAVLDELRSRVGHLLSGEPRRDLSGAWEASRSTLKRSQSATRLDKIDWRTDWMWEDHNRKMEEVSRRRRIRFLQRMRKSRPELAVPCEEEEPELPQKNRNLCDASTARKRRALAAACR